MNWIKYVGLFLFAAFQGEAQEVIYLQNPSFEGVPHLGEGAGFQNTLSNVNPFSPIDKWIDCGFKTETPPDLHGENTNFFHVNRKPKDGISFLGMVVRNNETWERVAQKLKTPLKAGKCYSFSIYLSRDLDYKSAVDRRDTTELSFAQPCVLRIFGGNGYCSTKELLAESVQVKNTDWKRYEFTFKPKKEWQYFEMQCFYKTPTLFPYNGNLLLDNASPIREIPCPEGPILAAAPQEEQQNDTIDDDPLAMNVDPRSQEQSITENPKSPTPKVEVPELNPPAGDSKPRKKILKDLDASKIKEGQVIQIEKLYFKADQAGITSNSNEVLDEVYVFLERNPKVNVEIGGHTNSKPKHEYCDRLSLSRAESVADYLVDKGIDQQRITAKGYGKRQPIAKGSNPYAHKKNQRVEIKILSLDGTLKEF